MIISKSKLRTPNHRIYLLSKIILFFFTILISRSLYLHLFQSSSLSLNSLAKQQYTREIKLAPYRGTIYDHRKSPLAISLKTPSVAVNPRVFNPDKKLISTLSKLLNIKKDKIKKAANKNNYFAWLKRKISHKTKKEIVKLNIEGLHFLTEPSRYYPTGRSASPLIGSVGIDNTGLFGLELRYDTELNSIPSSVLSIRDARGNSIFLNTSTAQPQQEGNSISLTIDKVIQEITMKELAKGSRTSMAKGGFAIVADPHTGKILAMANYPSFDPNRGSIKNLKETTNQAGTYLFEPGSVIKPLVIASAIEQKITSRYEIHDCEKDGRYKVDERTYIHDDHPKEFRTTSEIIIHSSNICTAKIAEKIGAESLYLTLKKFGFAKEAILGLPGELPGRLSHWSKWSPIRLANISFGQGFLVNGTELIQAYSSIANGGHLIKPYIIDKIQSAEGQIKYRHSSKVSQNIIDKQTTDIMKEILGEVVSRGTASEAQLKDYSSAGKTGTSEKYDVKLKRYSPDKRTASFIGFAPINDPHIVILVVIDEPGQKPYYGGKWAAPIFRKISEATLKYLNVAPDKVNLKL